MLFHGNLNLFLQERLQNESKEAKAEIDAKHQRAADEMAAAKEASDALDDKKQKTEEDLEKMKTNAANEAQKEADDIRNKAKEANEAEKEETDTAKPDLYQVVY